MSAQSLLLVSVICSRVFIRSTGNEWNYMNKGPDVWKVLFSQCAKNAQSPINIISACTSYNSSISVKFSPNYSLIQPLKIVNSGHTIVGKLANDSAPVLDITGIRSDAKFAFVNFHLHWGTNYRSGSEHTVNGDKYSGELHMVHMNPLTHEIAVLAFLLKTYTNKTRREKTRASKRKQYKSGTSMTTEWNRFLKKGATLTEATNTTTIYLNLWKLIGNYTTDFWRYTGSLTTPPCTEGVIWNVFRSPIELNDNLLAPFRNEIYISIFRDPQPTNERTVFRNFQNETKSLIPDYVLCYKTLSSSSFHSNSRIHSAISFFVIQLLFFLTKISR